MCCSLASAKRLILCVKLMTKSDYQLPFPLQTMYDRVLVSDAAKASVPSPVYLSRFVGRNGLNSKSVMVADSKTVVVKGFTFRGLAPGKKIIQLSDEYLPQGGWQCTSTYYIADKKFNFFLYGCYAMACCNLQASASFLR